MKSFLKFLVVGLTSAVIDFGVLNILILIFGTEHFILFKSLSFVLAVTNSYLLNKYWSFDHGHVPPNMKEGGIFFAISIVGLILNVTIASAIFHAFTNRAHPVLVANFASAVATGLVLAWNFSGYKLFVFKRGKQD